MRPTPAALSALHALAREIYGDAYAIEVTERDGRAVVGVAVDVSAAGGDPRRVVSPAALAAAGIDAEDGDAFVLTLHTVPPTERPALVAAIVRLLGVTPEQDAAFVAAAPARVAGAAAAAPPAPSPDGVPAFVDALRAAFAAEVPEVADGAVEIARVAWDPASRHGKVAVRSDDPDLDPAGAVYGHRGQRILAVLARLSCTLDVVPASPDPYRFVVDAMGSASALRWRFDEDARRVTLLEPTWTYDPRREPTPDARDAAFATNLRLAEALTGWSIDTEGAITWIDVRLGES